MLYEVITRFPPEPNGYLHIGHAKAILLSYGMAKKYNGLFNLRFDDTNPDAEETEYVESIKKDVRWLGADWEDREFFASNYFDVITSYSIHYTKLYDGACRSGGSRLFRSLRQRCP